MTQTALQGVDPMQTDIVDGERTRFESLQRRVARPMRSLRAIPHVGTWTGVLIVSVGAVLLVIAWVRTAALTDVALQIPYVVSAGFTGLGLVAVGITVVNISTKREDAQDRMRQVAELRELLAELRRAVEDRGS